MAKDIFGLDTQWGGTFLKGTNGAAFSANGNISLVQNWSISYQLQFQQIFECGSNKIYFAAGTPQGNLTIARIVSGEKLTNAWDVCNPKGMTLKALEKGCKVSSGVTISLTGVVLTGIQWSGQAANAYVDESVAFSFASASY